MKFQVNILSQGYGEKKQLLFKIGIDLDKSIGKKTFIKLLSIMRKLALNIIIAIICFSTAANAQPMAVKTNGASSKTTVPASTDRQFKRDAARMALRLDSEKEDSRYLPIAISRDNINSIYKALTNIYINDETGKSIARCNIHTFPNPSIDHIVVIYKRATDWAAPLSQGISETTNKDFNKLLDQYDLAIEKHVQWNDTQDAITLRSKEPINMAALASQFDNIPGIVQIDLGLPKFGGNDIKAKRIAGGWEIDFIYSFGTAVGGNGKQHSWKFKALDNGQVTMLKESGEPLPTWMKCDVETKTNFASKG